MEMTDIIIATTRDQHQAEGALQAVTELVQRSNVTGPYMAPDTPPCASRSELPSRPMVDS